MNSASSSGERPYISSGVEISRTRTGIVRNLLHRAEKQKYSNSWIHRGGGLLGIRVRMYLPSSGKIIFQLSCGWPAEAEKIAEKRELGKSEIIRAGDLILEHLETERLEVIRILENEKILNQAACNNIGDPHATNRIFYGMIISNLRSNMPNIEELTKENIALFIEKARFLSLQKTIGILTSRKAQEGFRAASGVENYSGLFPEARNLGRKIVMHAGPTNSGKTYAALQALKAAESGIYLAPLRLMALETFDTLSAELPVNLVTGEECITVNGALHTSSTVEMLDTMKIREVGVLDEIQMLSDASRGWAWTRAAIGAPVRVLHMTGSEDAIPRVKKIAELCGEELTIHHYERLSPLTAIERAVPLKNVRKGDAVIAFSRKDIFTLREIIRENGLNCAMLYGALGPEVRKSEAARFRSGEADVLVATDAVGMGLNLPVSRVLLSETVKFDGTGRRTLKNSEIRQICGRAGRYGISLLSEGLAGVLIGNEPTIIKTALSEKSVISDDTFLYAMPHWELVEDAAALHKTDNLCYLIKWCSELFAGDYKAADIKTTLSMASVLDTNLSLKNRYHYLGCPVETGSEGNMHALRIWSSLHACQSEIPPPCDFSDILPEDSNGLRKLEEAASLMSMWLWLNMRWPEVYADRDCAVYLRSRLSDMIEKTLRDKAVYRRCIECGQRLNSTHRSNTCIQCL